MGEGDVDARHRDEAWKFLLLVIVDGLAILEDAGDGLDERDELVQVFPEFRSIGDGEDDVGLRLLGKAAPTGGVVIYIISLLQESYILRTGYHLGCCQG